jgi:hypothetical protein
MHPITESVIQIKPLQQLTPSLTLTRIHLPTFIAPHVAASLSSQSNAKYHLQPQESIKHSDQRSVANLLHLASGLGTSVELESEGYYEDTGMAELFEEIHGGGTGQSQFSARFFRQMPDLLTLTD